MESVQVEGEVTAFRYFQATEKNPERFTGYYPKVTFATPTGLVTVDASTGSPLALADQPAMLGRKVDVRYLPEKPMHGRVVQWPRAFALDALPLVTLLVLAAFGTLYFAWVMWPTGGSAVRKAISG